MREIADSVIMSILRHFGKLETNLNADRFIHQIPHVRCQQPVHLFQQKKACRLG